MSRSRWSWALLALLVTVGCRQDMHDQPKVEPLEASRFFADGQASRAPVEGTVARGQLNADRELHAGITPAGEFTTTIPIDLERADLERGRDLYNAFCAPCHDQVGTGRGPIVQRGFKQPQSFHSDRLRDVAVGYYFDVITNGFGDMSSYASQVPVEDRWRIAAYVRVLQLSQRAPAGALDASEQARLGAGVAAEEPAADGGHGGAE